MGEGKDQGSKRQPKGGSGRRPAVVDRLTEAGMSGSKMITKGKKLHGKLLGGKQQVQTRKAHKETWN